LRAASTFGTQRSVVRQMREVDDLCVNVWQGAIVVSSRASRFEAAYYKPSDKPQLILQHRTYTEDHELLAKAWQAANTKAREHSGGSLRASASVGNLASKERGDLT
jgi:hypothetical protein